MGIRNWSQHKKSCKLVPNEKDARIATLEKDNDALKQQLLAKDEQLKDLQEEIKRLLKEEIDHMRKRKQTRKRVHRTELERLKIAKRQQWLCAGSECPAATRGEELEEYDIDHIIPLSLGGTEDHNNLQALCPVCHRKKTDQERLLCATVQI